MGCSEREPGVVARDVDDQTSQQFVQAANFIGPRNVELIGENALIDSWESLPTRIAEQLETMGIKSVCKPNGQQCVSGFHHDAIALPNGHRGESMGIVQGGTGFRDSE